jgi:predicted solute-binding protein
MTGRDHARPAFGPYRVARIPYLNVAPFFLGWEDLPARSEGMWVTSEAPPRALGEAAERGELDAAVFAEADLHRLGDDFAPLTLGPDERQIGIANHDHVGSVFLFVRDPERAGESPRPQGSPGRVLTADEAARLQGARVLLTGESSTSVRLVRLLLEVRYGVRPASWDRADLTHPGAMDRLAPDVQAALVIGDTALRWGHRAPAGFALGMDLAAGWHEWTGLPFVFARWGVRRTVSAAARDWLARYLEASLDQAESALDPLVEGLSSDLGSLEDLRAYLRGFTYRLGPEELAGAELFHALLAKHQITTSPA